MHSCTSRANLELRSLSTLSTLSSKALMKAWYCIGSPLKDGRLILGAWSTPISVSKWLARLSPALSARLLSLTGPGPLTVSSRLGVRGVDFEAGIWLNTCPVAWCARLVPGCSAASVGSCHVAVREPRAVATSLSWLYYCSLQGSWGAPRDWPSRRSCDEV